MVGMCFVGPDRSSIKHNRLHSTGINSLNNMEVKAPGVPGDRAQGVGCEGSLREDIVLYLPWVAF